MGYLTFEERQKIQYLLQNKVSVKDIAMILGRSEATIYNERKRGRLGYCYSAKNGERKARAKSENKGRGSILEKNPKLCMYISESILDRQLSPERIVDEIKLGKTPFHKNIIKSRNTIYKGIDLGLIPNVTRETLRNIRNVNMFSDGHIIIPTHIRKQMDLNDGDSFDILYDIETKTITLRKISNDEI